MHLREMVSVLPPKNSICFSTIFNHPIFPFVIDRLAFNPDANQLSASSSIRKNTMVILININLKAELPYKYLLHIKHLP